MFLVLYNHQHNRCLPSEGQRLATSTKCRTATYGASPRITTSITTFTTTSRGRNCSTSLRRTVRSWDTSSPRWTTSRNLSRRLPTSPLYLFCAPTEGWVLRTSWWPMRTMQWSWPSSAMMCLCMWGCRIVRPWGCTAISCDIRLWTRISGITLMGRMLIKWRKIWWGEDSRRRHPMWQLWRPDQNRLNVNIWENMQYLMAKLWNIE